MNVNDAKNLLVINAINRYKERKRERIENESVCLYIIKKEKKTYFHQVPLKQVYLMLH